MPRFACTVDQNPLSRFQQHPVRMEVPAGLRRVMVLFAILWSSVAAYAEVPAKLPAPGEAVTDEAFSAEVTTTWSFTNDGRGTRTEVVRARVFSPAGVHHFGQLAFGYNLESESLSIDFVRVRKTDGKVVETPVATAAEASLEISKEAPIYTDYRERNLSVVGLSPGDAVEYQSTLTIRQPLAPNQFWLSHFFNRIPGVTSQTLIVEIPRERAIKIKSSRPYESSSAAGRRRMQWTVVATRDDAKSEEKKPAFEEPAPDVQLSTFDHWRDVARWYDALQRDPSRMTPELKAKALELTKGALTDEERVRRVYAFVSRNIRYVSVSFGVGRFQPHQAETVLHNKYGDCKDKHTLLAALLQAIGITSRAVLIHSIADLDPDVPSPSQFDHVISLVELGGRQVWLDSTSGSAPFGHLFASLRDKQALLIAPHREDVLIHTAEAVPVPESNTLDVDGRFSANGDLEADIRLSLQGDLAVALRNGASQVSQANWKDFVQQLSYGLGYSGVVTNASIENLDSVDLPLLIGYHYSRRLYFAPDEKDATIGRKALPFGLFGPDSSSSVLGGKKLRLPAGKWVQRAKLAFTAEHRPVAPIPITLTRDYGSYQSKYELTDHLLAVERITEIKVASLSEERRHDLNSFMRAIEQDDKQELVVKLSPSSSVPDAEIGSDAESLTEAAVGRLRASDFTNAARLALKATQVDPQMIEAWNTLGVSYLGYGEVEKALQAAEKAIALNPYDQFAYDTLGSALYDLGRSDEAIAAFRKHLEVVPLDFRGRVNLGLVLLRAKRHEEAIPELEKAVQINDEPGVRTLLYQAYRASGIASRESAERAKVPEAVARSPFADLIGDFFPVPGDPVRTRLEASACLNKLDEMFEKSSAEFKTHYSASLVSFFWSEIGWAHYRMENLEMAERYLIAAWNMTHTAAVGSRLAQVYEKGNKIDLAIKTYAEAMAGDGSKEEIEQRLRKLTGDTADLKDLLQKGRDAVTTTRMVQLPGNCVTSGSGELTLIFATGRKPENVILGKDASQQLRRCSETIKKYSFPITFPDNVRQRVGREAVMYCDAKGCSLSLVPAPPIR